MRRGRSGTRESSRPTATDGTNSYESGYTTVRRMACPASTWLPDDLHHFCSRACSGAPMSKCNRIARLLVAARPGRPDGTAGPPGPPGPSDQSPLAVVRRIRADRRLLTARAPQHVVRDLLHALVGTVR